MATTGFLLATAVIVGVGVGVALRRLLPPDGSPALPPPGRTE